MRPGPEVALNDGRPSPRARLGAACLVGFGLAGIVVALWLGGQALLHVWRAPSVGAVLAAVFPCAFGAVAIQVLRMGRDCQRVFRVAGRPGGD